MKISSFSVVGFSGSRSVVPSVLSSVCSAVASSGASVFVGCAGGVDGFVRSFFPSARVFSVASVGFSGRGAFARRSASFVSALASAGGCLVSFPSSPCPSGLLPSPSASRCFSGFGSGSWASLAFAVGSGVPCFVFLGSLPCPLGWGLSPLSSGWFCFSPVSQLSLFS